MTPRPAALASAAAIGALLLPAVLGTAGPAAAHGDTIHFTVTGDQPDGHVRAVALWDNDNDPVDEPVAGTLTAEDLSGRTYGPWALVAVEGGKAAYTTREVLPPGRWKVTVHCGFPDLGHGEATVSVPALAQPQPAPSPTATASPAPAPATTHATSPTPAPAAAGTGRATTVTTAVTALVATAALVAAALFLRARRSKNRARTTG
ncbi:hypothetical protein AB0F13_16430 [Streptomyces sp. NPDC026206]|uniref:hypothetical protein n=1 Tax=Streptomyces sp. NPDC026206 TaxID=3157089 RepID=UPI0033C7B63E